MTPCFHHSACRRTAEVEKNGKSLCRSCAAQVCGREYPLRTPAREPLYSDDREAAEALGLAAPRHPAARVRRHQLASPAL